MSRSNSTSNVPKRKRLGWTSKMRQICSHYPIVSGSIHPVKWLALYGIFHACEPRCAPSVYKSTSGINNDSMIYS